MKITRQELKKMIVEQIRADRSVLLEMPGEGRGPQIQQYEKDPDGYEGEVARRALYHMSQQAQQLHDMLKADDQLEPRVHAEITKAAVYLEKAFKAITYEKQHPEGR